MRSIWFPKLINSATSICKKIVSVGMLLICIVIANSNNLHAKSLSELSFLIGEFDDARSVLEFIQDETIKLNTGVSVQLEYDHDNKKLYLYPQSEQVEFVLFAEEIKKRIAKYPNQVYPVFLQHRGPENWIIKALNESGLSAKAYYHTPGEKWPNVETILQQGKQLIFFTNFQNNTKSKAVNYAWDHIAEYPFTSFSQSAYEGYYTHGGIENELMLVRDFIYLKENESMLPKDWVFTNTNPLLLDHITRCWEKTGKKPNFVFFNEYQTQIYWVVRMLNSYTYLKGQVTYLDKPLNRVKWHHNKDMITNGRFNFPIMEGYETDLTPFVLGYKFSPPTYTVTAEMQLPENVTFIAESLPLEEKLTGYYNFNNKLENRIHPGVKHRQTANIVSDLIRGEVLKIQNKNPLQLRIASEYGIVNNSFTISAWFKISDENRRNDYCIIGTNENEYRKGLHINIRDKTPYSGFYGNDVKSYEIINTQEWYHIAFRYNITNGEQSIFINGQKSGSSLNHPSFTGDSELMIGRGINQNNYFSGYVDDLCIWERALSDNEISSLPTASIDTSKSHETKRWWPKLFIGFLVIGLILIAFYFIRRRRKKSDALEANYTYNPKSNALLLFGDFTVINRNGSDITSMFSPKIKQVFVLMLLSAIKNEKGISTQKLTEIIWEGFSTSKAANNRGVTLNKLKKLIADVNGIEVFYEDGYWKVKYDDVLNCDYIEVQSLLQSININQNEKLSKIFGLIQRGIFMENIAFDWLDDFRSNLLFDLSDAMLIYCDLLYKSDFYEQLFKVSSAMLKHDDMNEHFLYFHINYLGHKGFHSKAKHIFDDFCRRYQTMYNEAYPQNYNEFTRSRKG